MGGAANRCAHHVASHSGQRSHIWCTIKCREKVATCIQPALQTVQHTPTPLTPNGPLPLPLLQVAAAYSACCMLYAAPAVQPLSTRSTCHGWLRYETSLRRTSDNRIYAHTYSPPGLTRCWKHGKAPHALSPRAYCLQHQKILRRAPADHHWSPNSCCKRHSSLFQSPQ